MTSARGIFADLSDDDLLMELRRSVAADRAATARVVEVLAEVDARRLYLGEGCSSLLMYCTRVLHLSEHAAYNRIEAARLARRMPQVLDSLRQGNVTLTTVCLLGPHLTADNCRELLAAARHRASAKWSRSSPPSIRSRTFVRPCGGYPSGRRPTARRMMS